MKGDETAPAASATELQRLQALRSYALSDASTQQVLRELTDLTAQICVTPFAAVAFVDDAQTRFEVVSGAGFPCDALPRHVSFCGYAIQQADLFIVPDATLDARFAGVSLVAPPAHIRFYAGAPLITSEGHVLGTLCVFDRLPRELSAAQQTALRVLSRQVMAQLDLRRQILRRAQSEDRLTLATDAASIGVWDWDLTTDEWYASPVYCSMLGYPPDTGPSDRVVWLERLHPEDRARVVAKIQATIENPGGAYEYEARMRHANGSYRWIHVVGRVLAFDERGRAARLIGVRMDVTERKVAEQRLRESEAQLRQSQRLEAVGRLAGGIAHDFNNVLTVIQAYAELITGSLPPDDSTRAMVDEVQRAGERAVELTRQLLAFSRQQVLQTRVVDLNDVVLNLTKMLRRILGEDVDLRLKLHPRPLRTRADAGMLDQVLMNLVVNARDAMATGGRLTIETSERRLTAEPGRATPEAPPGRYSCVSVADTGPGIPQQHLARIFEPFYTTKDPGKGTGLGLATAFGIVKQHGGSLTVHSVEGQGATFQVLLPSTDDGDSVAPAPPARAIERGGGETILLVEDEATVRRVTRRILEQAGYHVLEAFDAADALQVWDNHQGTIDLLITDIVMPGGIDGRALAERLCLREPALRVILTSGYSADIAGRDLSLRPGHVFLQKPAGPGVLLDCVRRCLTDSGAR